MNQRTAQVDFKWFYLPKLLAVGAYAIIQLGVAIWLRYGRPSAWPWAVGPRLIDRHAETRGNGGPTARRPATRTLNIYTPTLNNASIYDYALYVRRGAVPPGRAAILSRRRLTRRPVRRKRVFFVSDRRQPILLWQLCYMGMMAWVLYYAITLGLELSMRPQVTVRDRSSRQGGAVVPEPTTPASDRRREAGLRRPAADPVLVHRDPERGRHGVRDRRHVFGLAHSRAA